MILNTMCWVNVRVISINFTWGTIQTFFCLWVMDFFINPSPKVCCYWELGEQIGNIINNHSAFDGNMKKSHGISLGTSNSSWNYSISQVFECQENTLVACSQGSPPIDPNVKPWHRAFPWVWSWSSSHYQLIDSATTYNAYPKIKNIVYWPVHWWS
jgi:hypothetical protein